MNIKDISQLIASIKSDIDDEYRAYDDDDTPGIQLTLATNDGKEWTYQTGDNSFMGSAYHYSHWSVRGVYRDTNCRELAKEMIEELRDNVAIANDDLQFTN